MNRVCFQLWVDPNRLDEYRRRHAAVWPKMLRELEAAGRRDYSLFLRPDGLLIGYYETDSTHRSDAQLAASRIAAAWEEHMADLFIDQRGRADQSATILDEVFHLENQLADLGEPPDEQNPSEGART